MKYEMVLEISDGQAIMGGFEFTGDDILFACDGYAHPVIFAEKRMLGCIISTKILFNHRNVARSVSRKSLETMHASTAREILENELMLYRVHEQKVAAAEKSWKNVSKSAPTMAERIDSFIWPILGAVFGLLAVKWLF